MKHQSKIAFILAAVIFSSTLASCSGNTDDGTTPSEQGKQEETPVVTETISSEPEYTIPEGNYNGETFNFYIGRYDGAYHINQYDGISSEGITGDAINDAIYERNLAVEEALNIQLTATHKENWICTFVNSIVADDKTYDAGLIGQYMSAMVLGSEGYLYNLQDIGTLDFEASWVNQNVNDTMNINNKQYVMISDACITAMTSGACLYFSKSLVNDYHLDDPYQMVFDGKWTLDNYIALCEQVSEDRNGDGIYDTNDAFGMNGSPTVMAACVRASDIPTTDISDINAPKITLNTERTLTVIDKLNRVLANTQINLQTANLTFEGDPWYDVILPMFKNNQLLFTFNWVFYALELRDMETDFGILPMPKFDETQKEYRTFTSDTWTDLLCVPATTTDADKVGHVLNAVGYYSQQYLYPEVIKRTVMGKTIRDESAAEVLDIIFKNIVLDANDFFQWDGGSVYNIWVNSVNSNSNTFASDYAALNSAMQIKMEATLENYK